MGLFNLVWLVFVGWWSALAWLFVGAIFALTVVGVPIAKACFQFAKLSAFPFGKEVIRETELKGPDNVSTARKVGGIIVNVLWFPVGLMATIGYFFLGILCFCTIIGIPVGVVMVKMGQFVFAPIGAKVVSKKQAYAAAAANEMERRN